MADLKVPDNLSQIMKDRYYRDGEDNIQQVFRRVSKFIASGEEQYGWSEENIKELEDKYYNIMNNNLFIPSSPFLMNSGTQVPMLFACFLVGGIDDDLGAIYEGMRRQGFINKQGGGTGFNFSKLREEGSPINSTGGTSSGVMSCMDVYNKNGEYIKQGGKRRSANIGILRYDHPEIMKFINYKNDHNKLTNFNVSVLVDDKFMNMVKNNEEYNLVSPTGPIIEKVNAREVFQTIVKNNWESGEPGLLFQDNINANNPMQESMGDITGCNPCFTGDMKLLTTEGYQKFKDIPDNEPIEIINCHGEKSTGKVWNNGDKETVKLIFSKNKVPPITCTMDHTFLNTDYQKVQAIDLLGDRILPMLNNYIRYPQAPNNTIALANAKQRILNTKIKDINLFDLRIVLSKSVSFMSNSISFVDITNSDLTHKISQVLAKNDIEHEINDNETTIDILDYQSLVNYYLKIGFTKETLNKELKTTIINNSPMVVDIIPNGTHKVYDFSEPKSHWGAVNGFIAHNCGEITMYEDEACCLGSLNLSNFVDNGEIMFNELERVVRLATRFLDTAIDVNLYPDKIIEDKVKSLRRIGLGIMGLHHMLIKLGLQYDSEDGRTVAHHVMSFIDSISHNESEQLAQEKSPFPLFNISDYEKPTRNVSNTMIAPTGTISQIANSSSGCEPVFALAYERLQTLADLTKEKVVWSEQVFEEIAIKEGFYSEELMEKIAKNKGRVSGIDEVPEMYQKLFKTAMEIKPEDHVKMQAALQDAVSASISKTINLPKEATEQDIWDAYMLGWELGVKGMTVYRDGSRFGQVLSVSNDDEEETNELKRGEIIKTPQEDLIGLKSTKRTGCGNLHIDCVFNTTTHELEEVWLDKGSSGGCIAYMKGLARMISTALRAGVHIDVIISQLNSTPTCPSYAVGNALGKTDVAKCCPSMVARTIIELTKRYNREYRDNKLKNNTKQEKNKTENAKKPQRKVIKAKIIEEGIPCPMEGCDGMLIMESGCQSCPICGYSKCD